MNEQHPRRRPLAIAIARTESRQAHLQRAFSILSLAAVLASAMVIFLRF